jgi:hypothetical protein
MRMHAPAVNEAPGRRSRRWGVLLADGTEPARGFPASIPATAQIPGTDSQLVVTAPTVDHEVHGTTLLVLLLGPWYRPHPENSHRSKHP